MNIVKNGKIYKIDTYTILFSFGFNSEAYKTPKGNFVRLDKDEQDNVIDVKTITETQAMDEFLTTENGRIDPDETDEEDVDYYRNIHKALPKIRKYAENLEEV